MIALNEIAAFLDRFFATERFRDEPPGVYRSSSRLVHRIGLALEPWPGLGAWARREKIDALFLHRPWKLSPDALDPEVGVIAHHLSFDEQLTLGFNPRLAQALQISGLEVLGEKEERPLGMIGATRAQFFDRFKSQAGDVWGGWEEASQGAVQTVARVAVVGAMTDALVREANARGAQVYVTGQFRQPARDAVRETGMAVLVVGHGRSEEWGLRALAGVLQERWARLEVVLPPRENGALPTEEERG